VRDPGFWKRTLSALAAVTVVATLAGCGTQRAASPTTAEAGANSPAPTATVAVTAPETTTPETTAPQTTTPEASPTPAPAVAPASAPAVAPVPGPAPAPAAAPAPAPAPAPAAAPAPEDPPPAAVDNFDKAYARTVTADIVSDIATADERFLDQPEIGTTTTMGFLSADMGRLLNAGMPPVANKAHYVALVSTLESFYAKASDQLPDDVIGAAATYTVARQATSELLGLLNPVLGTNHTLPAWSFT
jgi:outer membrane biosynthesis protein TonB